MRDIVRLRPSYRGWLLQAKLVAGQTCYLARRRHITLTQTTVAALRGSIDRMMGVAG